jgi:hypothetical protein
MQAMKVNMTRYEATWGRKPRGRGCWVFDVGGVTIFAPAPMGLWDAARKVRQIATERGVQAEELIVLP